jgi:hypothetical protein
MSLYDGRAADDRIARRSDVADDYTKQAEEAQGAQEQRDEARKAAEAVPSAEPTPPGGQAITREDATAKKPTKRPEA